MVTQIPGGFILDVTWANQPSVNTSSSTHTRCKCSNFNLQSYGFLCGTAWVSGFLSFDFTQCESQGVNLVGRGRASRWGFILCVYSLRVCILFELGELNVSVETCSISSVISTENHTKKETNNEVTLKSETVTDLILKMNLKSSRHWLKHSNRSMQTNRTFSKARPQENRGCPLCVTHTHRYCWFSQTLSWINLDKMLHTEKEQPFDGSLSKLSSQIFRF